MKDQTEVLDGALDVVSLVAFTQVTLSMND